ncbi:two-component regulator propeller domain-containing protein [Motiliproteus sp. SC1-56]|uniref:ligand-binding sensor domain-containing protein n=1 Tax=Motiliproteus sp. SC1-56 TaxID=2799565 RepID=UPI001A8E3952|nr:two-component regulator propeller domain-containing protein [Motiliproteus sp. SC1-56]
MRLLTLVLTALFLWGCSGEDESAGGPPPGPDQVAQQGAASTMGEVVEDQVLDVFGVGDTVYVRSLAVESERGRLWVGTSSGVHEIDLGNHAVLNTFTRDHGLANEYVFAIGIDPDGYKWFGTNAGGVSRYKDGEWKTFFPMHGLADYWVYSFANGHDDSLWIGTWAGANQVNRKTEEFTTYVTELINEWVYGLGVDAQGRVWFGTEGGVSMFDGEAWQSWTHEDGMGAENKGALPFSTNTGLGTRNRHDLGVLQGGQATYNPNYVFTITVDDNNHIWAGTWGGGVSRFDGENWHNLTTEDGLAGNIVYSSLQARDGVFWFGTNQGLSRYDGKEWQTYNRAHGLKNLDVYALVEAPNGDIWAGTRGGVVRVGERTTPFH